MENPWVDPGVCREGAIARWARSGGPDGENDGSSWTVQLPSTLYSPHSVSPTFSHSVGGSAAFHWEQNESGLPPHGEPSFKPGPVAQHNRLCPSGGRWGSWLQTVVCHGGRKTTGGWAPAGSRAVSRLSSVSLIFPLLQDTRAWPVLLGHSSPSSGGGIVGVLGGFTLCLLPASHP